MFVYVAMRRSVMVASRKEQGLIRVAQLLLNAERRSAGKRANAQAGEVFL